MPHAPHRQSLRPLLSPLLPLLAHVQAAAAPAHLLPERLVRHGVCQDDLLRAVRSPSAGGLRGTLQGALQRCGVLAGEGGDGVAVLACAKSGTARSAASKFGNEFQAFGAAPSARFSPGAERASGALS